MTSRIPLGSPEEVAARAEAQAEILAIETRYSETMTKLAEAKARELRAVAQAYDRATRS